MTETRFISAVCSRNSRSMRSSATSVLTVRAPEMPSLKDPVIRELSSRIFRFASVSFFCMNPTIEVTIGMTRSTRSVSRQFVRNMTTSAPIM